MLFNIPIEPFEERYTEQWHRWFEREFSRSEVNYKTVHGEFLVHGIKEGAFLDVFGTNYYKAKQMAEIIDLAYQRYSTSYARETNRTYVHNGKGDVFFFHDLWYPGIESLAYIRDAMDLKFKIGGIFHAGTYDEQDFLFRKGMSVWGEHLEKSWIKFIDFIFLGTNFHKTLLQTRGIYHENTYVTGLPIYDEWVLPRSDLEPRKSVVVFPHRLDLEKQPHLFDILSKHYRKNPKVEILLFIKTKEKCATKKEYYQYLNKSLISVSFALQETFGIAMQESVISGCIPLVPNSLSYQELFPPIFRFETFSELLKKIDEITQDYQKRCEYVSKTKELAKKFLDHGSRAIPKMIEIMREYQGLSE